MKTSWPPNESLADMERRRLRDQFALAALPGVIASLTQLTPDAVARTAYAIADAMLRQRELP